MRLLYILWLRQVKKYCRSRSRIIGSLAQPILYLVALGYGLGATFQKAGGKNYVEFLAPGIIAMSILFSAIFVGIEIIWDKQFGFLKETMVAPVSRFQIMLGRSLGGATVATFQGLLVFVITLLIGFRPQSVLLSLLALVFMFLIALMFTALGTAIASRLEDMQGFQLIMNLLVMPIFFLSGALFPFDNLPTFLAFVVRIDPLAYGVDGLRGCLLGISQFGIGLDFGIIVALTAIFMGIGAWLFSGIEV